MVLIYAARRSGGLKIGFSVGKKLGNAVVRNRTKRRMREAVTPLIPLMAHDGKLIFIAKHAILDESFDSLRSTMRYLLKKAGLLQKSASGNASVSENESSDVSSESSMQ